jgi:hypothetical protein
VRDESKECYLFGAELTNTQALNDKLTPITYLVGAAPSTADVSLYCRLHPGMVRQRRVLFRSTR